MIKYAFIPKLAHTWSSRSNRVQVRECKGSVSTTVTLSCKIIIQVIRVSLGTFFPSAWKNAFNVHQILLEFRRQCTKTSHRKSRLTFIIVERFSLTTVFDSMLRLLEMVKFQITTWDYFLKKFHKSRANSFNLRSSHPFYKVETLKLQTCAMRFLKLS